MLKACDDLLRGHSDLETEILSRILRDHPSGYVIACGGGVIERRHNRQILQNFGRAGGIVVHITREKEEVIRYLINEKDRPQWGEEIRSGKPSSRQIMHLPGPDALL